MRLFECQKDPEKELTRARAKEVVYNFLRDILEIKEDDLNPTEQLEITNFIKDEIDE